MDIVLIEVKCLFVPTVPIGCQLEVFSPNGFINYFIVVLPKVLYHFSKNLEENNSNRVPFAPSRCRPFCSLFYF